MRGKFTLPVFPLRCSVKDNPGVYAASALCLPQGVLNCSCGPGPELAGLTCLREAEKYRKGCAETGTTWEAIPSWRGDPTVSLYEGLGGLW